MKKQAMSPDWKLKAVESVEKAVVAVSQGTARCVAWAVGTIPAGAIAAMAAASKTAGALATTVTGGAARAVETTKKARLDHLPTAGIATASAISGYATFEGLRAVTAGSGYSVVVVLLVALCATLAIQGLLVWAVVQYQRSRTVNERLRRLILYTILVTFSVGFGTAFWTRAIAGDRIAREDFELQIAGPRTELTAFQDSLGVVGQSLDALVKHSAEMADREAQVGDSCGYATDARRGPRYDVRMADAQTLQSYGPHVTTRTSEIGAMIDALDHAGVDFVRARVHEYERLLEATLAKAQALGADAKLRVLRNWLEVRIEQGRSGFVSADGREFQCADPTFGQLAGGVIAALDAMPMVEAKDINIIDLGDPIEAVEFVFRRIAAVPAKLAAALVPRSQAQLRAERQQQLASGPTDEIAAPKLGALPVTLGLLFDVLIFISATQMPARATEPPRGGVIKAVSGALRPLRAADTREYLWLMQHVRSPHDLLRARMVRSRRRTLVYAVEATARMDEESEDRALHTLMQLISTLGLARRAYDAIEADKFERMVRPVTLYPISPIFTVGELQNCSPDELLTQLWQLEQKSLKSRASSTTRRSRSASESRTSVGLHSVPPSENERGREYESSGVM
ncbi:MAG: hypothetical protein GKS06_00015 [Acidobacteria bacterium]|nr:hypothetical protein [Acidobacteriota bacterium]